MCTNINNYVAVRPRFDDENGEEQWQYGYRDDMIAQFKQDLYYKSFSFQDKGKDDQTDTLQNRYKIWLKFIVMDGPISDDNYNYDYNDDGLDHSVRGAKMFFEIREFEKLLDTFRCN